MTDATTTLALADSDGEMLARYEVTAVVHEPTPRRSAVSVAAAVVRYLEVALIPAAAAVWLFNLALLAG